ncbi:MAG: hypothetical protein AAF299_10775 [Pseudomonadota bacterium]
MGGKIHTGGAYSMRLDKIDLQKQGENSGKADKATTKENTSR